MVFSKHKKGQAAIEFLMTYGWMLLVVLIVGALIFSFVDFGSLLPNKVDLNNNLRGSATDSAAYQEGGNINSSTDDNVVVVFTYNGAKRVEIDFDASTISPSSSTMEDCVSTFIKNTDTQSVADSSSDGPVTFLNGQTGYVLYDCEGLIQGDVLEGQIQIGVKSTSTGLEIPSSGPLRLTIN